MSVVARDLSAFEAERQSISACVNTSVHTDLPGMTIDQLGSALHLAFLLTYNQGLHLIKIASDTYQYEVPMIDVIHNWKRGMYHPFRLARKV
jgi:6-phosphogluconate dehydrogenase